MAATPAIAACEVTKRYGSTLANDRVSLSIFPGTVHAVVGENGAGKSTLMRVLCGAEQPDGGHIEVGGRRTTLDDPREASNAGIGMVYQEQMLVGELSVWENVVLGWEPQQRGLLDRSQVKIEEIQQECGFDLPLRAQVADLALAQRQQAEILRAFYRGAEILVLDEPTAILAPQEARHLLAAVRRLVAQGKTVIFISHKLGEVLEIADAITVMRGGQVVGETTAADTDVHALAQQIVGRDLVAIPPSRGVVAEPLLEVRDLTAVGESGRRISNVSVTVHAGEIHGIAGVAGNGQSELSEAAVGLLEIEAGSVTLHGSEVVQLGVGPSRSRSVRRLRTSGLGYVPQDRREVGVCLTRPLWFSAAAGRHDGDQAPRRLISPAGLRRAASGIIERSSVKADTAGTRCDTLSGGNLQKFIVGRELAGDPRVLVAEDPTRGVDIGAAQELRGRFRDLANGGGGVLLVSTDLDELLEMCDRVSVFYAGELAGPFPTESLTMELLGRLMTGTAGHAR